MSNQPSGFSRNKHAFFGCGSLLVSFVCLLTLPITFFMTLAVGMGTGSGNISPSDLQTYTNLTIVLELALLLSLVIILVTAILGIVLLIAWAIKRFRKRPPSSIVVG